MLFKIDFLTPKTEKQRCAKFVPSVKKIKMKLALVNIVGPPMDFSLGAKNVFQSILRNGLSSATRNERKKPFLTE